MVDSDALPGFGFSGAFLFEIDGTEIGQFREVDGLEVEVEVFDFEEGGVNGYVHRLPGRVRWPNLIFRSGLTKGDALFKWLQRSTGDGFDANGKKLDRTTGVVTLVDLEGNRIRSWSFEGAFPVRWRGPRLSATTHEPLVEELEVSHQGFRAEDHQ